MASPSGDPRNEVIDYPAESRTLQRTGDPIEVNVGIDFYYTTAKGIGGRIKASAQDFEVREVSDYPTKAEDGDHTIATIKSTNWETNRLVRKLSRKLGISRTRVGFAGTKDKRAVTTQLMSFRRASVDDVSNLHLTDVEITDIYSARRGIQLGDLIGNEFTIVLREIPEGDWQQRFETTAQQLNEAGGIPNYFGIQRFGAVRPVTHTMGEHIVNSRFKEAVEAYLYYPEKEESEDAQAARLALYKGQLQDGLDIMPTHMSFERSMVEYLMHNPEDYIGALKVLPINLTLMFVHAYQSHLFNRILTRRIEAGLPITKPVVGDFILPRSKLGVPDQDNPVPVGEQNLEKITKLCGKHKAFVSIPCFGTEVPLAEGEPGEIEAKVIEEEGLDRDRFIVPEIPRLTTRGIRREAFCHIMDSSYEVLDESSAKVQFRLYKGAYATVVVREFIKGSALSTS